MASLNRAAPTTPSAALDRHKALKDLVLEEPETARVFQELGIDYCCRGDMTVGEACARKGLDPARVWRALEHAHDHRHEPDSDDPRALPTPALVDRIVERHHTYLRRALPAITPLIATVARVHGEKEPRLLELERAYVALREMILPHLDDEEQVLFPALRADRASQNQDLVRRELRRMIDDHRALGNVLEKMRVLAGGYVAPTWACTSTRALMYELMQLETDLLQHIHLENHVLAPRFEAASAVTPLQSPEA